MLLPFSRKRFRDLSEQEILALAISSEEDDARIYRGYAETLRAWRECGEVAAFDLAGQRNILMTGPAAQEAVQITVAHAEEGPSGEEVLAEPVDPCVQSDRRRKPGERQRPTGQFRKPIRLTHTLYSESGETYEASGRLRLNPYFFTDGESVKLAGALATFCPPDEKVFEGMEDAAMLPCCVCQ